MKKFKSFFPKMCAQWTLCRIQSRGTKNTLLERKQSNGTLKRKDISFLNDVISLFFLLHCIICHPARFFWYHVTIFSIGHIRDSMGTSRLVKRACLKHCDYTATLDRHITETCDGNLSL